MSAKDFIPEIFYYCDRWCENCPFTDKCAYFHTFRSRAVNENSYPLAPTEFWSYISEAVNPVRQFLYEWAQENNFPLDQELQALTQEMDMRVEDAADHPLSQLAMLYGTQVELFLAKHKTVIQQALTRTYTPTQQPYLPPQALLDVVKRYQHQIYIQLAQSLEDLGYSDRSPAAPDQKDKAKGMLKTTLLMIDYSSAAWGLLSDELTEALDAQFRLLLLLEKQRKSCLTLFPDAYEFVRPGFDQRIA